MTHINEYHEAQGVLILDRRTPVITALFGSYRLKEHPRRKGEISFSMKHYWELSWETLRAHLVILARTLGCPVDAGDVLACLQHLSAHFGADYNELEDVIGYDPETNQPGLEGLFQIAIRFDDGHHLQVLKYEAAFRHSWGELEYGGEGAFITRDTVCFCNTSTPLRLGEKIHKAMQQGDLDLAAMAIVSYTNVLLGNFRDEAVRKSVHKKLANQLQRQSDRGFTPSPKNAFHGDYSE